MSKHKFRPDLYKKYNEKDLKLSSKYFYKNLGIKLANIKYKDKKILRNRKKVEIGIYNALIGINCVVNKVPVDYKKIDTKKPIKKIKDFSEKSQLDLSTNRHLTSDIIYRRRFVSVVTSVLISNNKELYKKMSKPYKKDKNYNKYRIIKDYEMFSAYMNFAITMINDYKNRTYPLLDMCYIMNKNDNRKIVNSYLKKVNKDIKHKDDVKERKFMSDIFNLAYLLSTGKEKEVFSEKDFRKASLDDLSKYIRKLGKRVIKDDMSNLFDIYLKCNPKVKTTYLQEVDSNDINVIIGLLALSYIEFIVSDLNYHLLIRSMLLKPNNE